MQKEKFLDLGPIDIDCLTVLSEFKKIRKTVLSRSNGGAFRPSYLTFHVTHSSLDPSHIVSDIPIFSPELKTAWNAMLADTSLFEDVIGTWSVDSIRDAWKGSYTAQVIKQIDEQWRNEYGERLTAVKFFSMRPGQCLTMHTDIIARHHAMIHHIPVVTNPHCFIYIDGDCYKMSETGNVYKIRQDLPHTPVNAGETERVHLSFNTIPV